MISRIHRVSSQQLVDVLERGRVFHSPLFTVRVLMSPGGKDTKISVVAPKKTFKTAVARNKMKRRVYESVRSLVPDITHSSIIGIFAKAATVNAEIPDVTMDLRNLFVKAGILR